MESTLIAAEEIELFIRDTGYFVIITQFLSAV